MVLGGKLYTFGVRSVVSRETVCLEKSVRKLKGLKYPFPWRWLVVMVALSTCGCTDGQ